MFRFIFSLIAFISFVLCIAALAIGLRSYWFADTVFYTGVAAPDGRQTNATLSSGYGDGSAIVASKTSAATRIFHLLDGVEYQPSKSIEHVASKFDDAAIATNPKTHPNAGLFKFDYEHFTTPSGTVMWKLIVPMWVPVGIFAFLPAIMFASRRRTERS